MKTVCLLITLFLTIFSPVSSDEKSRSIAILTYHAEGLPPEQTWDPDSINSGITGSEEAVIYMAEHLARLGYRVSVFGRPPPDSPYSGDVNPRYLHTNAFNPETQNWDIAVCWRMPALGKELKKWIKRVYFWPHDRLFPLRLSKNMIESFDDVLWVSQWQREQWVSNNPEFARFSRVFGNGVNPDQFPPIKKRKNPYSCIYGSNYGQGLAVLLDLWPKVRKAFPKATLDIYYGWRHFGFLTQEQESRMRQQIDRLRTEGVVDHGMVGHRELNEAYGAASFWTYPCTGTETFSISALRAQASGAVPVIIEGSALAETVGSGYKCFVVEEYEKTLFSALSLAEKISLKERQEVKNFVLERHTWEKVAERWHKLFEGGSS